MSRGRSLRVADSLTGLRNADQIENLNKSATCMHSIFALSRTRAGCKHLPADVRRAPEVGQKELHRE